MAQRHIMITFGIEAEAGQEIYLHQKTYMVLGMCVQPPHDGEYLLAEKLDPADTEKVLPKDGDNEIDWLGSPVALSWACMVEGY